MSENKLIPSSEEIKAIEIMAKNATDSKYFEKLGGPAGIFSICMYARELGIPVMTALFGGMQSIMGKITISPQLMNSMIRRAGHTLNIDTTDERAIIKGTRKDTGETCVVSFSVDEAKKANLFKAGGGWDKYPSDMCFARAMSRLARRLFPDVIGACYVEGELHSDIQNNNQADRTNRHTEPLQEVVDENIQPTNEKFFTIFKDLDQEQLVEFINSRPNPIETMKKALSDVDGFRKWFNDYCKKKEKESKADNLAEEVLIAMQNGEI